LILRHRLTAVAKKKLKSKRTKRILAKVATALGPWFLRSLRATWRVRRVDWENYQVLAPDGARPVYTMWHENVAAGSTGHLGEKLAVLISQHRDGEIIARAVHSMGFQSIRGSSSRDGAKALRQMLAELGSDTGMVFTPDGPRGPARRAAPGAVYVAGTTGRPLVATGYAASRQWRLNSWDKMAFPKPFARVFIAYAEAIWVSQEDLRQPKRVAELCEQLGERMNSMHELAEQRLAEESR